MNNIPDVAEFAPKIYDVVKQVPYGMVTTYGDVARIVGYGCDARIVGAAMGMINDPAAVPWQRVINARGAVSARSPREMAEQRTRLEAEGVVFDERGRIDLARFGWRGPAAEWAEQHGYLMLDAPPDEPAQPSLF